MIRNLNVPKPKIVDSPVLDSVFPNDHQEDDDGTFYFETDYLALKGNPDYVQLMKCLVVLQAQRSKIVKDIDQLEELSKRADVDPQGVKNIILKGDAPFLHRLNVEQVPEIDWSKYKTYNPADKGVRRNKPEKIIPTKKSAETAESSEVKIRGRVYHEKKPETFNQLWTVEEQLRLEALLEEYPPEPIENRRWKKIATALGNRTTKQVCSRVQKYFQKLQKAGITAPGMSNTKSNRAAHVHRRHKHLLYKPTTFFPGVAMGELSSDSDDDGGTCSADLGHWKLIMKKIEDSKASQSDDDIQLVHHGFKCGTCQQDPIIGFKWECQTCPSYTACSNCMETMTKKSPPPHPLTHHFKLIEESLILPSINEFVKKGSYLDPSSSR